MSVRPMLFAYWLPSVGIGNEPPVHVPLTDVLNYKRSDGSSQIDVINLVGCNFNIAEQFDTQPLVFDSVLMSALTDGSVAQLQAAGIKVLLTIMGSGTPPLGTPFGWGSMNSGQIASFVPYLGQVVAEYGLDGIDIDDEYPTGGDAIVPVVQALSPALRDAGKWLTKALFAESQEEMTAIAPLLDWGGVMVYGDYPPTMEGAFAYYAGFMPPERITIGVNAGPIEQPQGNFTSIATTQTMAAWQPETGRKAGMMVWSFSQDIQQFTFFPQNTIMFPNANDHSWQQAIISIWEGNPPETVAYAPAAAQT